MNRSLFGIFLWVAVFFCVPQIFCQEIPMLHFTSNDGLPGNTVYVVYRDRSGFLWFGTDKGIARYNGIKFEVFTTFDGLPDNEVFQFCEDLYGRLWLVSFNGELCYFKNGVFHTSENTPLLKLPFQLTHVKLVSAQMDSSLIVAFHNRISFLNIGEDDCSVIDVTKVNDHYSLGELLSRKKIAQNRYKLTFTNTTIVVDTEMNVKQQYDVDTFRMDMGGNMQMFATCQGQEYVFSSRYIYNRDMEYEGAFPVDFHKTNYVNKIYFAPGQKFYATNNGLYINDTIHLLYNHNVSSVSSDRYGNFWVSTINDGVFVIKKNYTHTRLFKSTHEGRVLYSFAYKGQLFFAGGDNNLYQLGTDTLVRLVNSKEVLHETVVPNSTQLFLVDSQYRYFSFTANEFVHKSSVFDKKVFVKRTDIAAGARALFYRNEYLYLQKPDAVLRFRVDSLTREMPAYTRMGIPSKDGRVLWMTKDDAGVLWYSTMKGLYRISDAGIAERQQAYGELSLKMFEFVGGDVLGYTSNNLLVIFRKINARIKADTIDAQDCIWDKMYKISPDRILLSTNNRYRTLNTWPWQGKNDYWLSVIDDPFIPLQPEAVEADEHMCYFLKAGLITIFEKESIIAKPPPPKLFFTVLRSGNKTYQIGDELTIPYGESKNMNISFGIVSSARSNVVYQYSISKSSREYWTEIKGEDISLILSAYGNYTVKIRARTISSDFCKPVEFTLRVTRPFWVRWWFIVLEIAGFIYLVVFLSRKRLAYILNKKDREHETRVRFLKSEYKALNALMNPHFVFNTLNNVQGLINNNDKLAANEYLRVIADLIRQNMHNISKELIPLQKEIDLINNYLLLEKFRFKDKLNYNVIVDKGLDTSEIMIPPLLIQPLIENSIKHGILPLNSEKGAIYLNIFERRGSLCIEVKDNGVGLSYKKGEKLSNHESFGLKNIRTRIEQLSVIQGKEILFEIKEVRNEAENSNWTIASIVIPLDKDDNIND